MKSINKDTLVSAGALDKSALSLRPDLNNIEAVLFDLDDTLIDTLNTSYALVIKSSMHFDLPVPSYEHYLKSYGGSFPLMVKRWFPELKVDAEEFRQCFEKFGRESETPMLFDVPSVFARLKQAGYQVGIVTNSGAERAHLKLGHARVEPSFLDCVITQTETGGVLKPHPDGILLAMRKLGIDEPIKVLYVGNAYEDQLAAHAAGATFCGVNQAENWESRIDEKSYFLESAVDVIPLLSAFNPMLNVE